MFQHLPGRDDQDFGDTIVYTGHGGNDPATRQQVADQVLDRGNAALARNYLEGLPVRVLRGANGDPTYSPATGYRYDGLFDVAEYWSESGRSGHLIWRYRLVRRTASGARAARGASGRMSTQLASTRPPTGTTGTAYVEAVPTVGAGGAPFEVDPDKLDRATHAHAALQNHLAARLRELRLEPLSPAVPHDPEFDIAWRHDGMLYVCEVKTTSRANADRQLRLGPGQVLHYAAQLADRGESVHALVLTSSRESGNHDVWDAAMARSRRGLALAGAPRRSEQRRGA